VNDRDARTIGSEIFSGLLCFPSVKDAVLAMEYKDGIELVVPLGMENFFFLFYNL
jgi:hypothetical protein